jgi:serine/threonine-protein kinase
MAEQTPSGAGRLHLDEEERLAHALISRGLLTRAEANRCRPEEGAERGPEALLKRLVAAGYLTANQARRAREELEVLLGQQIPGYDLRQRLGQGAMGTVFKARQVSMDRLVAVKVLHPRLVGNADFLERFRREAHLAARLSHNNIVQAIDVGSAGPLHYFVMELVEGKTIRQELEAGKVYGEKEAVEIIVQIAQAVEHASRRGLIHRDIKPANIVLTADSVAKLADLGLARETADKVLADRERGLTIGTPYYIAPEQILGRENIDVRADLYSLGATLYHMVTGRPPYPNQDVDEVLRAHLNEELTPPDHLVPALSSGLGEVVELLMAKDRRQRYRKPEDLIIDLECLLAGEPPKLARQKIEAASLAALGEGEADEEEEAPPEPSWQPGWLWVGILAALLGVSLLANLILLLRQRQ